WPRLVAAGAALRDRHRWAVTVCTVAGQPRLCDWRAVTRPGATGRSPVRGVWNGAGVRLGPDAVAMETALSLPAGNYLLTASLLIPAPATTTGVSPSADLTVQANDLLVTVLTVSGTQPVPLQGELTHQGGPLRLRLVAHPVSGAGEAPSAPTLWIDDLQIDHAAR
ncbi:MAG TPA: hypothetical protein VIY56_19490, partial [Vicinamibacterales bacterium]